MYKIVQITGQEKSYLYVGILGSFFIKTKILIGLGRWNQVFFSLGLLNFASDCCSVIGKKQLTNPCVILPLKLLVPGCKFPLTYLGQYQTCYT